MESVNFMNPKTEAVALEHSKGTTKGLKVNCFRLYIQQYNSLTICHL